MSVNVANGLMVEIVMLSREDRERFGESLVCQTRSREPYVAIQRACSRMIPGSTGFQRDGGIRTGIYGQVMRGRSCQTDRVRFDLYDGDRRLDHAEVVEMMRGSATR